MTALGRDLRAVQKRIRLGRGIAWGSFGLAAGAGLSLFLKAASFFQPVARVPELCLLFVFSVPALGGILGFLWPVSAGSAARRVDGCGLMARVQTAIELQAGEETPMVILQREDARQALSGADWRAAMPLRPGRFAIAAAAGLLMAMTGLFFVPNPQDAAMKAQASFKEELARQAALLEEGAEKLDGRDARETQESRKLLGDLAEELRAAQSPREALAAIDRGERRLESIRQNGGPGYRDVPAGDGMNGPALPEAEAAQSTAESKTALPGPASASQISASQCAALLQMARTSTARAGQAMGSASQADLAQVQAMLSLQAGNDMAGAAGETSGQGGGGASRGSTNRDAGYREENGRGPVQGNAKPERKMGLYEVIYDPTRLGDGGEVTQERGEIGQGEATEARLGPGLGGIGEGVPYPDVALQYRESAAQAVENANLPIYVQKWVETYFTSLLE
ncbi:MAG: hypothetical protein FWF86_07985 [Clostridia bacterium]|nr:hypothetical protein [Clostridia bacterium]